MPTVNLSPLFNDAQLDSSGNPLSGGKLFTYAAGSSTKQTTYTSSAGSVAQANGCRSVTDTLVYRPLLKQHDVFGDLDGTFVGGG